MSASPTEDSILAAVRAFQAAWDAHDLDATLSLVTDDCVFESARPSANARRVVGRDALREAWATGFARGGAPFEIEDLFAAGDRAVQLWSYASGDNIVRGVDVFRVRDGRICEKFGYVKAG
jgi:ketosteroid isomerase-like protein